MFGPTGGNSSGGSGRNRGGSYGGGPSWRPPKSSYSSDKRYRSHPGGKRRTRSNHMRNIDILGNSKKPYTPTAGPGCGLVVGLCLALAVGSKRILQQGRG